MRALGDPLLIADMRLRLFHNINTFCLARSGPHTGQLGTTGTSSFVMMSLGFQMSGHCHYS